MSLRYGTETGRVSRRRACICMLAGMFICVLAFVFAVSLAPCGAFPAFAEEGQVDSATGAPEGDALGESSANGSGVRDESDGAAPDDSDPVASDNTPGEGDGSASGNGAPDGGDPAMANEINTQQLPDSSFIYDASIADLSGADAYYNDQTVQVVGEAIGDAINVTLDATHTWITLASTDGQDATVTVFMTSTNASRIDTFGAYSKTGTILQVRGTYHLVCKEHDGISDLHAEYVSVIKKGTQHADTFDLQLFSPGLICIGVGVLLMCIFSYLRERQR
jgi:hypothetical protein